MKKPQITNPFENLLKSIDQFFAEKKESEKLMIIAFPALVLGALAYYFLIPASEKMLQEQVTKQNTLKQSIQNSRVFITQTKSDNVVENLEKDIKDAQEEMDKQFEFQEQAENKLINIIMMQDEWHVLLNFVANTAKKHDIKVQRINSSIKTDEDNVDFENIEVDVLGSADFKNIMGFINGIESYGIFVQIEEANISKVYFGFENQTGIPMVGQLENDPVANEMQNNLQFNVKIRGRRAML